MIKDQLSLQRSTIAMLQNDKLSLQKLAEEKETSIPVSFFKQGHKSKRDSLTQGHSRESLKITPKTLRCLIAHLNILRLHACVFSILRVHACVFNFFVILKI